MSPATSGYQSEAASLDSAPSCSYSLLDSISQACSITANRWTFPVRSWLLCLGPELFGSSLLLWSYAIASGQLVLPYAMLGLLAFSWVGLSHLGPRSAEVPGSFFQYTNYLLVPQTLEFCCVLQRISRAEAPSTFVAVVVHGAKLIALMGALVLVRRARWHGWRVLRVYAAFVGCATALGGVIVCGMGGGPYPAAGGTSTKPACIWSSILPLLFSMSAGPGARQWILDAWASVPLSSVSAIDDWVSRIAADSELLSDGNDRSCASECESAVSKESFVTESAASTCLADDDVSNLPLNGLDSRSWARL